MESDYAKFEVDEPPLVLSLLPNRVSAAGKLNHLGIRLSTSEALVALQQAMEMQGLSTVREEGVACCHSEQTKFWITDPDGNSWEFYTLDDESADRSAPAPASTGDEAPAPAIWAHRLGEHFPQRLLIDDDAVDEVLLQGTFNAQLSAERKAAILGEVMRVLKAGAPVRLHVLSARRTLEELSERLPGPAAAVEAVPSPEELVAALEQAGFVDVVFERLGDCACFTADDVACHEAKLLAWKPRAASPSRGHLAMYLGPFRQLTDDGGQVFRRGRWVAIDVATFERLQEAPYGEQFATRSPDETPNG